MSSITIHDIDDELNERLTREARRRHTSKNALIKRLLAQEVGLPVDGSYANDYREFVGLWSSEEHAEFSRVQRENSTIDPADWT